MLARRFSTAFAARFAQRSVGVEDDSIEQALLTTGITLAATRKRRTAGIALVAAAAALGWARRRRERVRRA